MSTIKAKLDQVMEMNQSLEETKKVAFQQHEIYEQEIRNLQSQLDNSRHVSSNIVTNNNFVHVIIGHTMFCTTTKIKNKQLMCLIGLYFSQNQYFITAIIIN